MLNAHSPKANNDCFVVGAAAAARCARGRARHRQLLRAPLVRLASGLWQRQRSHSACVRVIISMQCVRFRRTGRRRRALRWPPLCLATRWSRRFFRFFFLFSSFCQICSLSLLRSGVMQESHGHCAACSGRAKRLEQNVPAVGAVGRVSGRRVSRDCVELGQGARAGAGAIEWSLAEIDIATIGVRSNSPVPIRTTRARCSTPTTTALRTLRCASRSKARTAR